MVPDWLHAGSEMDLAVALACALVIAADEFRRPQKMWIMNLVWPLCALFGSVIWLGFYLRYGRMAGQAQRGRIPFVVTVAKAASHCGSGCALGDICAEALLAFAPGLAVLFGFGSLFPHRIFANWVLDFLFAYAFGVFFQYYTIAPMRHLGVWPGIWAAVKADSLSLIAWQVGMYAFMAVAHFWIFQESFHVRLGAGMPEFWFMMQIAMICGFATSFPVNIILLRTGLKDAM